MNCRDFVARFSEYVDGTGPEQLLREAREHEASCRSCQRYRRVMEEGATLLRELPHVPVREDFRPRLQHRLYHVDFEASLQRRTSGATALTTLGMAVLLAVAAWSPALWREPPVVQLDPIVVTEPAHLTLPKAQLTAGVLLQRSFIRNWKGGLWADAHELLYEYSPVLRRYHEQRAMREAGVGRIP